MQLVSKQKSISQDDTPVQICIFPDYFLWWPVTHSHLLCDSCSSVYLELISSTVLWLSKFMEQAKRNGLNHWKLWWLSLQLHGIFFTHFAIKYGEWLFSLVKCYDVLSQRMYIAHVILTCSLPSLLMIKIGWPLGKG